MDEFAEACELLRKHLPEHDTKEQLLDMCKLMDINKDGLVDLNEFLETFRLCEQAKSNANYAKPVNCEVDDADDDNKAANNRNDRSKCCLNTLKKQSTEDDEEDMLLDCDSPQKTENGGVAR